MKRIVLPSVFAALTLLLGAPMQSAHAQSANVRTAQASTLQFDGTTYIHRHSNDIQHEYTPAGQEDLQRWQQMLTLVFQPNSTDQQRLAWAGGMAELFEKNGQVLYTSRPSENEYFIHAVLFSGDIMEVNIVRLIPHQGGSLSIMAQRRFYNGDTNEVETWLRQNGPRIHAELQRWQPPAQLP